MNNGVGVMTPEPGIRYIAVATSRQADLGTLFAGIGEPIVFMLNEGKNEQGWGCYYPFTLSMRKPEALYAFLKGDIYLMVVFDGAVIRNIHQAVGWTLTMLEDEIWAYSIEHKVNGETCTSKISRQFMGRVAAEFLSWKWVLKLEQHQLAEIERLGM